MGTGRREEQTEEKTIREDSSQDREYGMNREIAATIAIIITACYGFVMGYPIAVVIIFVFAF